MRLGISLAIGSSVASTPAPELVSLDDATVATDGGQSVTITGFNLADASSVTVGGTSASITANTATSLTFTAPAKTAGAHDVVVTTPGGASNALALTYEVVYSISIAPAWVARLDETSGTTADDAIGSVNGTHAGVTVNATGRIEKAATYAGTTSSYTGFGDNFSKNRTSAFSVSIWMKASNITSGPALIGKRALSADSRGWQVRMLSTGVPRFHLAYEYGTNSIVVDGSGVTCGDGAWHHVAVTYSGSGSASGVEIYVDGVALSKSTVYNNLSTSTLTNAGHLMIGNAGNSSTRTPHQAGSLTGTLDDAAIFNAVLTADDVAAIYAAGLEGISVADIDVAA